MPRQVINTGSGPLAGNGEFIYTAFVKINQNFVELYAKTADVPAASIGKVSDKPGMCAADGSYFYYCIADYTGTAHIWKRIPWAADTW